MAQQQLKLNTKSKTDYYHEVIKKCQKILTKYLIPSNEKGINSITDATETISELIGILDNKEIVQVMNAEDLVDNLRIVIYKTDAKQPFHFNVVSKNGQPVSTSENYTQKQMCKQTAIAIIENPPHRIFEIDKKSGEEVKIW